MCVGAHTRTRAHLFVIKKRKDTGTEIDGAQGKMRACSMSLTGGLSLEEEEDELCVCVGAPVCVYVCARAFSRQPHLVTVSS